MERILAKAKSPHEQTLGELADRLGQRAQLVAEKIELLEFLPPPRHLLAKDSSE